jgi:peptidoglycan/xylan/chitin deacetylase (PgdA/CDA1 family)
MKVITYHYVRASQQSLPYFKYLHLEDFKRQISFIKKKYGFVDYKGIDNIHDCHLGSEAILTFDDGLREHFTNVMPILDTFNIKAHFFISTLPYVEHRLLDVHRIHYLLGILGGGKFLRKLSKFIDISKFEEKTNSYTLQQDNRHALLVKEILNYQLDTEYKEKILSFMMKDVFGDEKKMAQSVYLSCDEIKILNKKGHLIGGHSHSHSLLSNLSSGELKYDLQINYDFLKDILLEPPVGFCYPYGKKGTYNNQTIDALKSVGFTYAYTVERSNLKEGFSRNMFELPRMDTNQFLHGIASTGANSQIC